MYLFWNKSTPCSLIKEQAMPKAILSLFLLLSSFCLCSPAFALPQQHEAWHQKNDAYRTMYDRYEIGLQRAYDALPEESYKKLEKENDAAIDESVKQAEAAGKNAALACAQALAERILIMEEMVSYADSERVAGTPHPFEGFYRLSGREGYDGYLTIGRNGGEDELYCFEIAVWQTDAPQSFGWSQARAKKLGESFSTTAVHEPKNWEESSAKKIQMHFTIKNGQATVTTTESFKKGGYVWFSQGENDVAKNILLDGNYRRMPCSQADT